MSPPPYKSKEQLREMEFEELVEYAFDRQKVAYEGWEEMMGNDL